MEIKFVDFKKSYQEIPEMAGKIEEICKNGKYILQEEGEQFERELAKYAGTKNIIAVGSGTDAIFLSLKVDNIGIGDEVITSGYTFCATIEAIIHSGAKPVLVDINDDLLINPAEIESKITKNTKAIIPVHIGGAICDMDKITSIAKERNLLIIEDTAQALGAYSESGKQAGTIGDCGCFSFYPAKVLGCYGDGGAIATDNDELAAKLRLLRNHGGKPYPSLVGYNSRLDNIQAVVLSVKLPYLDKWIERRNEIGTMYNEALGKVKSQTFQEYNYRVPNGKRDGLYAHLKENGIETIKGEYIFPTEQPPEAMKASKTILRLPIWPTLTNEEIEYIISKIKEYVM